MSVARPLCMTNGDGNDSSEPSVLLISNEVVSLPGSWTTLLCSRELAWLPNFVRFGWQGANATALDQIRCDTKRKISVAAFICLIVFYDMV